MFHGKEKFRPSENRKSEAAKSSKNDNVRKQPDIFCFLEYVLDMNSRKNKEDVFFQAMLTRDHRFDGKFFIAVKTTGIYCRPICPAKPKRENVEFFSNHLQAERAGYRPCLRCRPESAPMSAAWTGKSVIVQRAIKVLHNSEFTDLNEEAFAQLFGVSARHLRRLFIEEINKTPKQLWFENRLNISRKLISETALPISEVALASGFQSVRRFNDAFQARFKRSPSMLRRSSKDEDRIVQITLPYRPPFDFESMLTFYRNHQMGSLEKFEPGKMYRAIEYDGYIGSVAICDDEEKCRLVLQIDFPKTNYIHVIVAKVRNLFDLDSDPAFVANSLERDPIVKKLLKKRPGVRLPSGWDPFEVAVSTILGQLVSVTFARELVSDLISHLGVKHKQKVFDLDFQSFPTALAIANSDLEFLRTTKRRKQTLKDFCQAIQSGKITLAPTQNTVDFEKAILQIKGIGQWTADYISLKALRNADSFPKTDLILSRALKNHKHMNLLKVSPYRGYAATLLWLEHSQALSHEKKRK